MDEKVLLDVQINEKEALKAYDLLRKRVEALRTSLKDLENAGLKGSQLYAETEQEIKALTSRMAEYNKEIQNSVKRDHEKEGSMQQLKARLSLLTAEYNKLSRDERNAKEGMEMGKEIAALTKELTEAEKALGNFRRQVGHYEVVSEQLGKDMDGLTQSLIDMRLEGKQDTEEYKKMAAALAEIKTRQADIKKAIDEVNNSTEKVNVGEIVERINVDLAVLSSSTEKLGIGIPYLQEAISGVTAVTSLWGAAEEAKNLIDAKNIVMQQIQITRTKAQTKAIAAKTAMESADTIATKAITTATWLWNAALASNPIFALVTAIGLAITGIALLTKWINRSKEAEEEAAKASENYANAEQKTSEKLAKLDADRERRVNEISNAMRKEVLAMKARGATEKEIAEYQLKKEREIRDVETESAKVRKAETEKLIAAKQKEIEKNEKYLKKLKEGKDEYKEQKKKIDDMRKSLQELNNTRDAEIQKIADLALKNAEAEQQAREKQKEAWKKELDSRTKHEQKMAEEALAIQQKAEEAKLKQANASQAELFAAKQKWEADSFELSVEYQRKSLEQQKKAGSITKAEYERQMAEIAAATTSFYASQAIAAKDELLSAYRSVMNEVGEVVEKQIGIIDKNLADNLKAVGSQLGIDEDAISKFEYIQELMENHSGPMGADMDELTEEQTAWYKSMEEKMFEYYRVSQELDRQAEEAKTAIEMGEVDKRLGRVFQAIEDENALELLDYSKTEEEKNKIQIAATQKRLAALREEEKKATDPKVRLELQKQIAEGEEEIHTLMLDNMQLEADKALANANLTAKQKYDIELDYLNKRLEAVRGNADAEMEVEREIAELQKQRNLEKIAAAEEYANTTMDIAGKMSEMMAGIEQRKLDDFKDGQDEQKDALDKRLKDGLISQEEYDKQVADLDAELEKKQKEIELKQAKREKAISIMQTIINTAMGIAKAVAENPMGGGLPGSAIMAAVGAAQLAAIVAQPLPKASRGMLLRGPSHAAGGIPIEAEGGEAIINKKATSRYLPLLSAINESTGGVSLYSRGGMVSRSRDEMAMGIDYGKLAAACAQMNVQVAVTDINNGQSNMAKVVNRSRY